VCNSMIFSTFTVLCSHPHSSSSKGNSILVEKSLLISFLLSPGSHCSFCLCGFACSGYLIMEHGIKTKWNPKNIDQLLSLSMIFSKSAHIVASVLLSFLCLNNIPCTCVPYFV
jgi:hypothetical protein